MKVGIIGLGLIGGSLGLALKRAYGNGVDIKGFSRSEESRKEALEMGAIDKVAPISEMGDRDIIIISTPILVIRDILKEIGEVLRGRIIITDTGSTKREIMGWAERYLSGDMVFVGGHPMAGKEKWGIREARADIFEGSVYCIVPGRGAKEEDVEFLKGMVERIGSIPMLMDAQEHDYIVCGISHLPLALSVALILLVREEEWEKMGMLASTGFKDTTPVSYTHLTLPTKA